MTAVGELPSRIPLSFVGKWRATMVSVFENSEGKRECFRIYADVLEE